MYLISEMSIILLAYPCFRGQFHAMMADKLAGHMLIDPAFPVTQCPRPLADVKVTAISWRTHPEFMGQRRFAAYDSFRRQAAASELFGAEFEAKPLRNQHCVETCRKHHFGAFGANHRNNP